MEFCELESPAQLEFENAGVHECAVDVAASEYQHWYGEDSSPSQSNLTNSYNNMLTYPASHSSQQSSQPPTNYYYPRYTPYSSAMRSHNHSSSGVPSPMLYQQQGNKYAPIQHYCHSNAAMYYTGWTPVGSRPQPYYTPYQNYQSGYYDAQGWYSQQNPYANYDYTMHEQYPNYSSMYNTEQTQSYQSESSSSVKTGASKSKSFIAAYQPIIEDITPAASATEITSSSEDINAADSTTPDPDVVIIAESPPREEDEEGLPLPDISEPDTCGSTLDTTKKNMTVSVEQQTSFTSQADELEKDDCLDTNIESDDDGDCYCLMDVDSNCSLVESILVFMNISISARGRFI